MFFKIGVLKNFAILEPFFNKVADLLLQTPMVAASGFLRQQIPFSAEVAGLLLQNTCGGCFRIFAAADTFFS